ncbi:MAG: glycosyltransferase family 1 protein, partial [Pedobacter sp.]
MKKLAIIITHPIQYYAPVFKLLAAQCNLKVFYTWGLEGAEAKVDKGFNQKIIWDIPLLEGYEYAFLKNKAKEQGSHHFMGMKNPSIISKINNFNPDAILVYGWAYQSHLKVLRYFKGKIPIWFRGDSHLLDSKPLWKKLARKALLTWVYSYIDKAFYV